MNIIWQIDSRDIEKVQVFLDQYRDDPFVQQRIERNLSETKPRVSKAEFWRVMVSCLLSTQQRSGPDSALARFGRIEPFPLSYQACIEQDDLQGYAQEVISGEGLRRSNRVAKAIRINLERLEKDGLWSQTLEVLNELRSGTSLEDERNAANFIDDHFHEFGPKQSRNLLQSLGLTRYEIPLDSRITRWLNKFGFPIKLSAGALSDRNYYNFVSEGFQQLCKHSGVHPCVLDAAIFTSFDR